MTFDLTHALQRRDSNQAIARLRKARHLVKLTWETYQNASEAMKPAIYKLHLAAQKHHASACVDIEQELSQEKEKRCA